MKVITATSAGFCWGVRRAVQRVKELAATPDRGPIFTDGPLIHNRQMMTQLSRDGVEISDSPEALSPDDTLVIRAHGITPERRAALKAFPCAVVDATCPDVARIHAAIRKHVKLGYEIVIYGDPNHAEVEGLVGAAQGHAHTVTTESAVADLPPLSRVALVSQSTQLPADFHKVAHQLAERFQDSVILDTICKATKSRQTELLELAKNVDAFVVVGDAHSANTCRLVEQARTLRPTLHVQDPEQLNREFFSPYKTIGLTAGASTPDFLINSVRTWIEDLPESR